MCFFLKRSLSEKFYYLPVVAAVGLETWISWILWTYSSLFFGLVLQLRILEPKKIFVLIIFRYHHLKPIRMIINKRLEFQTRSHIFNRYFHNLSFLSFVFQIWYGKLIYIYITSCPNQIHRIYIELDFC